MPTHPFQTNFTSGELTERLDARVNLDKYQNGARCILNASPTPHGGASRRAGTYYVATGKLSAYRVRLVPFRFSVDQACTCWSSASPTSGSTRTARRS